MKSIKDNIIYIRYEEKVCKKQTIFLIQQINEESKRKLLGIYISLKDIPYSLKEIKELVNTLDKLSNKLDMSISIGDYDLNLYMILKNLTKPTYIKLFENFQIAKLFLIPNLFKSSKKILLLHDKENDVDKQASILTRYEYTIMYAKSIDDLQKQMKDGDIDFVCSKTKINLIARKNKKNVSNDKRTFKLSKAMIVNLPTFVDTAVDTLVTITALDANKISHCIRQFDENISNEVIISIMKFSGDFDGSFVLIFPTTLAKKSIEAMLGETLLDNDTDSILDGIGEFCNIITGSIKTNLSKKNINMAFDLPKTYSSVKQIKQSLAQNNGIWINMELSKKPFYMFIVK